MNSKGILLLLSLITIIVGLTGCIESQQVIPSYSYPVAFSEANPQSTTQEAITTINKSLKDISSSFQLTNVEISKDSIKITEFMPFTGNSYYFTYSFNSGKEISHGQGKHGTVVYSDAGNLIFNNQSSALQFISAVYFLKQYSPQERQKEKEDCLRVIRSTPIKDILSGGTTEGGLYREPAESTLNDILIEWKNKKLPELLQMATAAQLSDLVIKLEKGIFNLDLEAKKLKNLADEDARQATAPGQAAPAKTAPAGALTIAHLLEQRKAILLAILNPVRQAAAQRASGG